MPMQTNSSSKVPFTHLLRGLSSYGVIFSLALALYALSAGAPLVRSSLAPHYVYLAYAMLHGKPYLDPLPPTTYDLLPYQGHWYVAGSPMPALLLTPGIALRGLAASDILFGVVIGALNVTLIYDLLGQLSARSDPRLPVNKTMQRWLTIAFAAGTVHWYVSILGSVWFNAHAVAVTFIILYVREALVQGRGWLAGSWLALATLSRPTTLFAATFFIVLLAIQARDGFLRRAAPFLLTLGLGVSFLLIYNVARFGHALDFGYAYVQGAANITNTYARYGGFNVYYLPCNLYVSLAGLPDLLGHFSPVAARVCRYLLPDGSLPVSNPWLSPNPLGMSVFLTTPVLLYMLRAFRREPLVIAAWIGLLSVAIPLWMYHNTGSLQFGYRYSLDTAPFWMILVAAGLRGQCGRLERGLIVLSVLVNFAGMTWMFAAFNGISWLSMWQGMIHSILH